MTTIVTEEVLVPVPVAVPSPADAPILSKSVEADKVAEDAAADAFDDKTPDAKLPQVPSGATVTLAGKNLGERSGRVTVQVNGMALPADVVKWEPTAATVTLPTVELKTAARARIELISSDGKLASAVSVNLLPALPAEESKAEAEKPAGGSGIPDLAQSEFDKK